VFELNLRLGLYRKSSGDVTYYSEYIDRGRFYSPEHLSMMRDYLRAKYANVRIDGLVVVGDAAAELLLGPGRDLFANTPMVFHAVVSAGLRAQAIERGWQGVVFSPDHRNTVDLALRLHPNTREVWVIVASTGGDHAQELAVRAQLTELAGRVTLRYFTHTS